VKVENILDAKGRHVETIAPDATVLMAVHRLTSMKIGALVVSVDGERVEGVLSERDIVSGLLHHGDRLTDLRVREVMARSVPVCGPGDTIKQAMAQMTRTRNRHLPVVDDGKLCGLLSIGDVVKNRLEEMELETNVLRDAYIARR
jgi:CBS domain-containing protein